MKPFLPLLIGISKAQTDTDKAIAEKNNVVDKQTALEEATQNDLLTWFAASVVMIVIGAIGGKIIASVLAFAWIALSVFVLKHHSKSIAEISERYDFNESIE